MCASIGNLLNCLYRLGKGFSGLWTNLGWGALPSPPRKKTMTKISSNIAARYFAKYFSIALATTVTTTVTMHNAIKVAESVEVTVRPSSIQIKIDSPSHRRCLMDYPLPEIDKKDSTLS